MSDILSQEQIDALLASDQFGSSDSVDNGSSEPSAVNKYPVLSNFFQLLCAQAGTVITTVVSKETTFAPQEPEKADFASVQSNISSVVLSLDLAFKSGLEGELYLIIGKKDVAILSDLMTMGDGTVEYNDDHKDAIGELFNQVMGAFSTALGGETGTAISAGNVVVNEFDLESPPFTSDSFDMVIASLNVDGFDGSKIAFLIPEALTEQLVQKLNQQESSSPASDSVGLSLSELDDLSRVTSFDSADSGFQETSLTGQPLKDPSTNIDMLLDIELDVSIELGKTLMSIKRVLELAPGAVVELDRMAGEPVDLLVNNKVVARGEVVVIDESFGIRIVSLVSAEDRIKSLR